VAENQVFLELTPPEAVQVFLLYGEAAPALLKALHEGLEEVLKDPRQVRSWLEREHPRLGARPLDLLLCARAYEVWTVVFPDDGQWASFTSLKRV